MTVQDIVKLNPTQVRNDKDLMPLYIEMYTEVFGSKPNCAGCTFKKDFNKLKKAILTGTTLRTSAKNFNKMAPVARKYKLNRAHENRILTYRTKSNRPVRTYGYGMSDEFAENFLKHGTKKELAERAKLFDVIDGEPQGKKGEAHVKDDKDKGTDDDKDKGTDDDKDKGTDDDKDKGTDDDKDKGTDDKDKGTDDDKDKGTDDDKDKGTDDDKDKGTDDKDKGTDDDKDKGTDDDKDKGTDDDKDKGTDDKDKGTDDDKDKGTDDDEDKGTGDKDKGTDDKDKGTDDKDKGTDDDKDKGTDDKDKGTDDDTPEAGTPIYDPKVVKYLSQAKVNGFLTDNLLDPKDYKDLKAGKEALLALKH